MSPTIKRYWLQQLFKHMSRPSYLCDAIDTQRPVCTLERDEVPKTSTTNNRNVLPKQRISMWTSLECVSAVWGYWPCKNFKNISPCRSLCLWQHPRNDRPLCLVRLHILFQCFSDNKSASGWCIDLANGPFLPANINFHLRTTNISIKLTPFISYAKYHSTNQNQDTTEKN